MTEYEKSEPVETFDGITESSTTENRVVVEETPASEYPGGLAEDESAPDSDGDGIEDEDTSADDESENDEASPTEG